LYRVVRRRYPIVSYLYRGRLRIYRIHGTPIILYQSIKDIMDEERKKRLEKKSFQQEEIYQDFVRLRDKKKTYDTFNLEEEIQHVWQTKDDLDAIAERHYDDPEGPMTEDELSNVLIGLSELHETRMKKLWKVFETMVKERGFSEND